MIRVGMVDIETSHKNAFAKILHEGDAARVAAICPGTVCPEAEARAFAEEHGIETVVSDPAALADAVDVIFLLGTDWTAQVETAKTLAPKGKPLFIDKPFAGSVGECLALERLVREEGARIVGSSSLRYAPDVEALKRTIAEAGETMTFVSTSCQGQFDYAIHSTEMLGGLAGAGAEAVRWIGGEQPAVYQVRYPDGPTALMHVNGPAKVGFCCEVGTNATYHQVKVDVHAAYAALMENVIKSVAGDENILAPVEALTESIRIFLAADQSGKQDGAWVALADLEPDAPGFDGPAFAKAYGEKKRAAAKA